MSESHVEHKETVTTEVDGEKKTETHHESHDGDALADAELKDSMRSVEATGE